MSDPVDIIEVGPRDGLQNENRPIALEAKVRLIEGLAGAGLRHIEAGSFVSPRWVPQMADSTEVFRHLRRKAGVRYTALTPNLKGLEQAMSVTADEVAVFTAVSETFCQRNINCSIDESLERFAPVIQKAREARLPVRAYVSCVWGCPYEGKTDIDTLLSVCRHLLSAGCYEISLGDTIGVGTAPAVEHTLKQLLREFSTNELAVHFHDTYGQALVNIDRSLNLGITRFDSSIAGLGGCPYAQGASGNVATEDVVYLLKGYGLVEDLDLDALIETGNAICQALERENGSKVARAVLASRR